MNVKKIKNIALTISILGFAIGFSDLQENIFFWMAPPVGAVGFVTFFILTLLEKEYELLDEQERTRFASLTIKTNSIATSRSSIKETCSPALTTAASH